MTRRGAFFASIATLLLGFAPTFAQDIPAAEGKITYPLTLTSPYGETVLEQRPTRIVVLGPQDDLDAVLVLGLTPVMSTDTSALYPWSEAGGSGNVEVLLEGEIAFESILAADPDLIVALTDTAIVETYDRLSQIAPVLTAPVALNNEHVGNTDWRSNLRAVAEALDLSDKGEQVIQNVDAEIAEARAAHPEFDGKTIAMAINYGPAWGVSYFSFPGSPSAKFFESLGFSLPESASHFSASANSVLDEQYSLLDADILLVKSFDEAEQLALETGPVFSRLSVVEKGGYFAIPDSGPLEAIGWGLRVPTALSEPYFVKHVVPILAQIISDSK